MTRAELYRYTKLGFATTNNSKSHTEAPKKQLSLQERIIAFNLDPLTKKPRLYLVSAVNAVGGQHD